MTNQDSSGLAFLFTDIQGSTKRWEEDPETMAGLVEEHDGAMYQAVSGHHGTIVKQTGDGVFAVFDRAEDAVAAAVEAQRTLPDDIEARMGIHFGSAVQRGNDFFGNEVNRAARLMAIAHGGQIIVSGQAESTLGADLGEKVALKDLGSHRLRDLSEPLTVYQVVADGMEATFPHLNSLEGFPNNLPAEVSSFIGRGEDIRSVGDLMSSHRLVSLTGAGGSGKTRLALQVAADALPLFDHGAWFVDLAGLSEPELIPMTIGAALGLKEKAGRDWLDVVGDHVRTRNLLIVLDNCEHLLDEAAVVVGGLLGIAPNLRFLTTTREPLNVPGEVAWRVPTLDLPPGNEATMDEALAFEGVRLFVERALAARPDLDLSDSDVPSILEICRRLDGLPLALELAAARVRVLSVREIADHLGDRFSLLSGGSRTALPRHRTLEGTVAWSYESLTEEEQTTFRRLSVFSGGFGLSGALVLGGPDALAVVTSLVEKSLLSTRQVDGETRYRMLETVAAFAHQRLGEQFADVRDAHLQWAAMLAGQAFQELEGAKQVEWLERVSVELDNIRAAMQWALDGGDAALGTLVAGSLYRFWYIRAVREGRRWLDLFRASEAEIDGVTQGRILFAAGSLAQSMGDYETAETLLRESMEILHDLGEERAWAYALHYLTRTVWGSASKDDLRTMVDTAAEVFERLDDNVGIFVTLLFDAVWHLQFGSTADIPSDELRRVGESTRSPQLIAHAAEIPAAAAWYEDDVETPRPLLAEAAAIYKAIQNQQCAAHCIENTAGWAYAAGKSEDAVMLLGAAEALRADTGIPTPDYELFAYDDVVEGLKANLGDDYDEVWRRGALMSMDEALDYVIRLAS